MNSNVEKVIVFKNDAVGDLVQSLNAINNIIDLHKNKNIEIYLSERSEKFRFLINKGICLIIFLYSKGSPITPVEAM